MWAGQWSALIVFISTIVYTVVITEHVSEESGVHVELQQTREICQIDTVPRVNSLCLGAG